MSSVARTSRRNNRRRNNNRPRSNRNDVFVSTTSSVPYPLRFEATLKYASQFVISTGAIGIPVIYSFQLNNLNDPDYSNIGTNHQPYGWDALKLLYSRYRAMKAHWKITAMGIVSNVPALLGIVPTLIAAPNATFDLLNESPYSKSVWCSPTVSATITGSMDLPRLFGMTKSQYLGDDSTESIVSSGPTTPAYLNFCISNPGVLSSVVVNLEMYCTTQFFEITQLGQS